MEVHSYPKLPAILAKVPDNVKPQFEVKYNAFIKQVTSGPTPEGGWSLSNDEPVNGGFKMWSKKDDVWVTLYSEITVEKPIEQLTLIYAKKEERLKFDDMLESIDVIKEVNDAFAILRTQMKGKFMIISPRDFITYRIFGWLDEKVNLLS